MEMYKDRIIELARERDGFLTAADVLEDARRKDSPLHEHFEWNDGKAAEAYRIEQARKLIQSVRITFEHAPNVRVQALVSLASDRKAGGGYRFVEDVLRGPDEQRRELLDDMRAKSRYWAEQCEAIAPEFAPIVRKFSDDLTVS